MGNGELPRSIAVPLLSVPSSSFKEKKRRFGCNLHWWKLVRVNAQARVAGDLSQDVKLH